MKLKSSIKKRCNKCIIIKRYNILYIMCVNLKHKQKQG